MNKQVLTLVCLFALTGVTLCADSKTKSIKIKEKDMLRKSIVYDKNTPDVFYCPVSKPIDMDKLIVRSRTLHKLCEFEGKPLPEDYKSDCYQDVDESAYACKEKYRIMINFFNNLTYSVHYKINSNCSHLGTMDTNGLIYANYFEYTDVLRDIVKSCNNDYRRTIKMAPIEMRQYPPGSDKPYDGKRMAHFMDFDKEIIAKMIKQ